MIMRDLIISTIEQNFRDGYQEIGRNICATIAYPHPILATLNDIENNHRHELLNPWLKSLTDEQLLGVLESQHCEMYR